MLTRTMVKLQLKVSLKKKPPLILSKLKTTELIANQIAQAKPPSLRVTKVIFQSQRGVAPRRTYEVLLFCNFLSASLS
uniref:Uncharacterized protein n=1 Tax=Arundo donax TaxID=35708 RepID=A0A0A9UPP5_ARUDO